MKINSYTKYGVRFLFLQFIITYLTIFYFDKYLISNKFCEYCAEKIVFEFKLTIIYGKIEIDFFHLLEKI